MNQQKSKLGFFNEKLIEFFKELSSTFPEEKEIKMGLEAIEGTKKINPRLILDLFYDNVYKGAHGFIEQEDEQALILYAKNRIDKEYNEMSPTLSIFEKHWEGMSEQNQSVIWQYLKVLCILCEKARQ